MAQYKIIDIDNWERKMHCMAFRNSVELQFCVTANIDVTEFLKRVKANGWSFTYAMVFAASKCANEIVNFKYRFADGNVVVFDRIDTSFTYLNSETELFKVINVPMCETIKEYIALADKTQREQTTYFTEPMGNNIFQFSAMPWVSYTHISHTNSGRKDNATPLFDWGKYYEQNGKMIMPFSVQAHHSFVDGIHVGRFYEKLQNYIDSDLK